MANGGIYGADPPSAARTSRMASSHVPVNIVAVNIRKPSSSASVRRGMA